jgi:heptosyltransferase-2
VDRPGGMETETVAHGDRSSNRAGLGQVPTLARLVVVSPNWLGDAVMALPAIADVRRALPDAEIVVAARAPVAPIFTLASDVSRVVTLDRRTDVQKLRECSADAALLLPNSFHAALGVWRAGVAERWGYDADWRGRLLTKAVVQPGRGHQVGYYQYLTHALGFPRGPMVPRLTATPEVLCAAAELLTRRGWDGRAPLVALAPGAAFGGAKRWPPERFAELAVALSRDKIRTVIVGGPGDMRTGRDVVGALGAEGTAIDLVGHTDLPTLAGVLASCRRLVTNDSGAMHVAAALGVPVTALFGPTREHETHPLGSAEALVLTNPVWCRPCMLRECPIDHRCLRGIHVEAVLRTVRERL